jgi:hypothetical protein
VRAGSAEWLWDAGTGATGIGSVGSGSGASAREIGGSGLASGAFGDTGSRGAEGAPYVISSGSFRPAAPPGVAGVAPPRRSERRFGRGTGVALIAQLACWDRCAVGDGAGDVAAGVAPSIAARRGGGGASSSPPAATFDASAVTRTSPSLKQKSTWSL